MSEVVSHAEPRQQQNKKKRHSAVLASIDASDLREEDGDNAGIRNVANPLSLGLAWPEDGMAQLGSNQANGITSNVDSYNAYKRRGTIDYGNKMRRYTETGVMHTQSLGSFDLSLNDNEVAPREPALSSSSGGLFHTSEVTNSNNSFNPGFPGYYRKSSYVGNHRGHGRRGETRRTSLVTSKNAWQPCPNSNVDQHVNFSFPTAPDYNLSQSLLETERTHGTVPLPSIFANGNQGDPTLTFFEQQQSLQEQFGSVNLNKWSSSNFEHENDSQEESDNLDSNEDTEVVKKGSWTQEEDDLLRQHGNYANNRNWTDVAAKIPGRTAKQCRERWCYNLDPHINKNLWRPNEDHILIARQREMGNRWAQIAQYLTGRTENAVKTRFKSILRARKREWHPREDQLLLKMYGELGPSWVKIAAAMEKNRTKHAVRMRFRQLQTGLVEEERPGFGSARQTVRESYYPAHSLERISDLYKRLANDAANKSTKSGQKIAGQKGFENSDQAKLENIKRQIEAAMPYGLGSFNQSGPSEVFENIDYNMIFEGDKFNQPQSTYNNLSIERCFSVPENEQSRCRSGNLLSSVQKRSLLYHNCHDDSVRNEMLQLAQESQTAENANRVVPNRIKREPVSPLASGGSILKMQVGNENNNLDRKDRSAVSVHLNVNMKPFFVRDNAIRQNANIHGNLNDMEMKQELDYSTFDHGSFTPPNPNIASRLPSSAGAQSFDETFNDFYRYVCQDEEPLISA